MRLSEDEVLAGEGAIVLPVAARLLPPLIRAGLAPADLLGSVLRASARILGVLALAPAGVVRTAAASRGARPEERLRLRACGLQRLLRAFCNLHGFQARVRGGLPDGPAVIVANHVSYLDPLLLGALSASAPIAKREIAGWPGIGGGARRLGVLFVDRRSAHSGAVVLRRALRALRAGVPVLGFPEGTTSAGHDVLPFRRGMMGLARLAGVPVVPVALRYQRADLAWTGDASLLPHYLRTSSRAVSRAEVIVGEPVSAAGRAAGDLALELQARVARLLRS